MIVINQIFLDIDGVLADFVGGAIERFQLPVKPDDVTWDFLPSECWAHMDADFWAGLNPLPDCHKIVERLDVSKTWLLTSLPQTNRQAAGEGKYKWVEKHLPQFQHRLLFCVSRKSLWAHGAALLIDDHDANVNQFREAGGHAVLVPRPWNSGGVYSFDFMDTVEVLCRSM